jgi:hypothetical protein
MKLQLICVLVVALITSSAFAANNRKTASNSSTALTCSSEYQSAGNLSWALASDRSGFWILTSKSSATLTDSYGTNGPKVTIEAIGSNKEQFRIRVTHGGKELVNTTSPWTSLQVTFPISYTGSDSEDPPHFDLMRVTCEKSFAAG